MEQFIHLYLMDEVAWWFSQLSNFEFNILNKNQFGDITSQIYM